MQQHERKGTLLAGSLVAWSAICYTAYAWAAIVRLDLHDDQGSLLIAITALAALFIFGLARPLAAALLVLAIVPLFGNHPGGRMMELINLPLAASAAGLAVEARLHRRPRLSGPIWIAAALYLASAVVAIVPAVPGMMVQAAQLNHWPTTIVEALTTPEVNPLYSLSSLAGVSLCVAWAAALAWRAPDHAYYRRAVRTLITVFFVVVGIGVLDQFDLLDVTALQLQIDPRRPDVSGFQSIFWNPGWFAWYFVMLFGLALGFLWTARPQERIVLGALLVACYALSFLNPQRGGLVALHLALALAAWLSLRSGANRAVARRVLPIAAILVIVAVAAAYAAELIPRNLGSSLYRLFASPDEAVMSNSVRLRLWTVALQMWRDAPVFGIGEGSFGWRFQDYAPAGSALFTTVHGDAHSTWLQILATRGLAGVVAFGALLWAIGRALRAAWIGSTLDRGLVIGFALSLGAFLVYSTVQGMFYLQGLQILFWFIVAAASAAPLPLDIGGRWRATAAAAGIAVVVIAQTLTTQPLYERAASTMAREPDGFYPVEGPDTEPAPWRWSAGAEATLCLQPETPRVRLRLATGDPRADEYPRRVTIKVNDTVVDTITMTGPDAVTREIGLPWSGPAAPDMAAFGECTGRGDDVRLTVAVDETWSPLGDGVGADPRTFGVRLYEPAYLP